MRSRSKCSSAGSKARSGRIGELAQLLRAQRDLPAAGGDEEAERGGGGVALIVGQLGHDVVEVPVDDRVGAAQTPERLQPETLRPGGDLLVPQAPHDELQVGRLHAGATRGADSGSAVVADADPSAADLLEHRVHECRLDLEVRRGRWRGCRSAH